MSPEIASIIIILLRLIVPFSMLRFPLAGILLSIAADASDVMIFDVTGYGYFDGIYHHVDKVLDIYYLSFAWLVARKWRDMLAARTATVLFFWRFLGVIAFELTGWRPIFLLAPSIFENFYILYLAIRKFRPAFEFQWRSLVAVLLIAGIPKVIQEYIMHFKYIDQTWTFLRANVFWWLYK